MGDVINNLRAQGVDDEDIQTTLFNIQPEYTFVEVTEEPSSGERVRRTERRLVGFRVTNTLSVKVRDLESIGPIIDGAVAAGGDVTRINNIQFTVEEVEELQSQARTLAIRDAVAKAEQLAGDTGATLGPLLFISESGGPSTPVIARTEAPAFAADAATPISLGELDVTVIIQAIWAIE